MIPGSANRLKGAEKSNPLTFGLTLANGEFVLGRYRDTFDGSDARVALSWERAPDNNREPLLFINSVRDEHGLPVALQSSAERIRLRVRPDYRRDRSNHKDHLTIGGLDLDTDALTAADKQPLPSAAQPARRERREPLKGRLSALQVKTGVEAGGDGSETLWDRAGEQVKIRDALPKRINGGSHNAFFALASEQTREVALELEDVAYQKPDGRQPTAPPLVLKRLRFGAGQRWTLRHVYEEEAYGKDALPKLNMGASAVGMRESSAAPTKIGIPAMDIRYAAANMPAAGTQAPENSNTTAAALEWYKETDDRLVAAFGALEHGEAQKHLTGFRLLGQDNVGYATILGRMRATVPEMKFARDTPILAEAKENTFKFGVTDPFRRKRAIRPSAALSPETDSRLQRPIYPPANSADDVARLLRAVKHRVWLLTYILDSEHRDASDFGTDAFGVEEYEKWKAASRAVTALKGLDPSNPFNLSKIRGDLLEQLEGLTAPSRQVRQVVFVLAKLIEAEGDELLDALAQEVASDRSRLRKLAGFQEFQARAAGRRWEQRASQGRENCSGRRPWLAVSVCSRTLRCRSRHPGSLEHPARLPPPDAGSRSDG